MTVLCANCHTANRDRAMFCIGCASKLPAFAATGPSALDALGPRSDIRRGVGPGDAGSGPRRGPVTPAARGMLIAVLLLGATVVALLAWIGFGPQRSAPPAPASTTASVSRAAAASATPLPTPVPEVPVQATVVVEEPAPAAVDSPEPEPLANPAPARAVRSETPTVPKRVVGVTSAPPGRVAADPRAGCEQLFFVLAARCEANHCEQAAYSRHPRCAVVREQRQRDEARRNLTQ